ncbi:type IV pilin protein [Piscinibacter sp. XHJ-5]|uniref:type IV pilin protein n=1 Tax=Piscinibacter sp. XHJ-5 TaxID=3037797 RepID=UPI002452F72B|nr:type IV pilin protein [Piscinibacter sp. XHJ-5]
MKRLGFNTAAGFTLIEMMCTLAMGAVLGAIAYPSFQGTLHRVRRADALVALMQLQSAQERYRADHAAYGDLPSLRAAGTSPAGHYRLAVAAHDATGYDLRASAAGGQHTDTDCRHLRLLVVGADIAYASGSDERFANAEALNRRCWSL